MPPIAWRAKARRCCGAAISRTRASCCRRWRAASTASRARRKAREAPAAVADRGLPSAPAGAVAARAHARHAAAAVRRATTRSRCAARPTCGRPARKPTGRPNEPSWSSLRELLGLIGAHEWRKKGVEIPALGARIHPHYGVFSPVRGEYVDLVAQAPLPSQRSSRSTSAPAPACWRRCWRGAASSASSRPTWIRARWPARARTSSGSDSTAQVEVMQADLFPEGRAPLVVCNPPWLPARPSSPIEHAIYDPDSRMLRGFLAGLAAHLDARRRRLADPVRSRGASRPAAARAVAGMDRRGRLEGRRPDRRAAAPSARRRRRPIRFTPRARRK